MSIAETLKAAKEVLWDGTQHTVYVKDEYICHAIERVTDDFAETDNAIEFLETYGMSKCGTWFYRQGGDKFGINVQTRRHVFLDVAIRHATKLGI
jgi:hypothetical protein